MTLQEILEKLGENPITISIETVKILLRIIDNILKDPKNPKLRKLLKSNSIISTKILSVHGALLCLNFMGFQENGEHLILPDESNLSNVEQARDTLLMWLESVQLTDPVDIHERLNSCDSEAKIFAESSRTYSITGRRKANTDGTVIKPIVLPQLVQLFKNPFLHQIETVFHSVQMFDNKDVQKRAKSLIPLEKLEQNASNKLHSFQVHVKKGNTKNLNISIQEMLILELLQWFKEEFFTWVNSPNCEYCSGKTNFSHMSTDKDLLVYTNRVELHRCESCHQFTPFPRYNDLNILLETRKGRCGEWANTFTLFCRAMGWDSRFVMDETDHVWTEVYSIAQQRWLHCDSCENVCDRPLMYESGWKKKVSYVMAYSGEEVQDVSWRYSSNHKATLQARTKCTEKELVDALVQLREIRQKHLSEVRRKYLTKRILYELVELMVERKPNDEDKQGRESGDLNWRLLRGETDSDSTNFVWDVNVDGSEASVVTIKYSASKDTYIMEVDGVISKEVKKWNLGNYSCSNIIRKEEKDWKQVYLARQDGTANGNISWRFKLKNEKNKLELLRVHFSVSTFENGNVETALTSGNILESIPTDGKLFTTTNFVGQNEISLSATLSGGKGDVSWQHAQLFRQTLISDDYPFVISFVFH